jgi:hypothetical protein
MIGSIKSIAKGGIVGSLLGRSARKAKEAIARQAEEQRRALAVEADRTSNQLLLEAEATNDQRQVVQERLLLAEQAESEAERQALNAEGPEVTLGAPAAEQAQGRQRRRRQFFGRDEGVLL